MKYPTLLMFLLTLTLVSLACGGGASFPATPKLATVAPASPAPENSPIPPDGTTAEQPVPTVDMGSIPGLMIAYIREGNLWFWSEANGPYQMTNSGDLTDVCISEDGQMLAFIRGAEIWTARTDGTEAHLLATHTVSGGALKFSPNGLWIAVSDEEQIQVVNLATSVISTVLTFPMIAGGYEPEVVWSPDSSGFKTVIPAAAESGQAEFFYVFTTGTAASLAKFAMVPTNESAPFLSPDGGYVIYVAKMAEGKKSLYLMDSSGATKPYGEPADRIRAYGWLPDSKHFVYGIGSPQRAFAGDVGGQPGEISLEEYDSLRWVDAENFLSLKDESLYLASATGEKALIDSGVSRFDFSQ